MLNHKGTQLIKTDRLTLRPFTLDDAQDMYHNWAKDEDVARYLSWIAHSDISITKAIMQVWIDGYSSNCTYNWGIVYDKIGTNVIGSISVIQANEYLESCVIGYCISKKYWNQGIVTEALSAMIDYLFDCGFVRISAYHDIKNEASGKVMKKCGMQFEGILRSAQKNNKGEFCDIAQYAILNTDIRP